MLRKKILISITIYILTTINTINCIDDKDFMIIFWDPYQLNELKDIKNMTYQELKDEYEILNIIHDDSIIRYYWDEQIFEVDMKSYREKTRTQFINSHFGLFSIVLNDKIIINGQNRTAIFPAGLPTDNYTIPVIQRDGTYETEKWYFLLNPRKTEIYRTFKDFNKVEKEEFLSKLKPVYDYFNLQSKIVGGVVDLSSFLTDETYWRNAPEKDILVSLIIDANKLCFARTELIADYLRVNGYKVKYAMMEPLIDLRYHIVACVELNNEIYPFDYFVTDELITYKEWIILYSKRRTSTTKITLHEENVALTIKMGLEKPSGTGVGYFDFISYSSFKNFSRKFIDQYFGE